LHRDTVDDLPNDRKPAHDRFNRVAPRRGVDVAFERYDAVAYSNDDRTTRCV
jgi:hypothetical protein